MKEICNPADPLKTICYYTMTYKEKLTNIQEIPTNFIRFYLVGLLLFCIPFTRSLFILLIPASLLLVIGIAFYFHRNWTTTTIGWFLFIIISSFLLEMMGISTGKVFGHYRYGSGLGWQIAGTPPLIGINWLFLVYASNGLAGRITSHVWSKIPLAATIMIFYDLVVEMVAPAMQMWRFTTPYPPASNFIAWFLAGLVYHTGFAIFRINSQNHIAGMLFLIQMLFFICIILYQLIFSL